MAAKNLNDYEEIAVGDEVEILASEPTGMYEEGEVGNVQEIVEYTGTADDRVAIYVLIEDTEEPIEISAMDLAVIS